MATNIKNRVPTYPGRVKLLPVEGQAGTYTLTRADEPTEPGTAVNKALLDAIGVHQLDYAKSGTVHVLTGLNGATGVLSCQFKATAAFAAGDTVKVDGTAYTIQLSNGETADDNLFVSGAVVAVILDTGAKKANFKAGGKGGGAYCWGKWQRETGYYEMELPVDTSDPSLHAITLRSSKWDLKMTLYPGYTLDQATGTFSGTGTSVSVDWTSANNYVGYYCISDGYCYRFSGRAEDDSGYYYFLYNQRLILENGVISQSFLGYLCGDKAGKYPDSGTGSDGFYYHNMDTLPRDSGEVTPTKNFSQITIYGVSEGFNRFEIRNKAGVSEEGGEILSLARCDASGAWYIAQRSSLTKPLTVTALSYDAQLSTANTYRFSGGKLEIRTDGDNTTAFGAGITYEWEAWREEKS